MASAHGRILSRLAFVRSNWPRGTLQMRPPSTPHVAGANTPDLDGARLALGERQQILDASSLPLDPGALRFRAAQDPCFIGSHPGDRASQAYRQLLTKPRDHAARVLGVANDQSKACLAQGQFLRAIRPARQSHLLAFPDASDSRPSAGGFEAQQGNRCRLHAGCDCGIDLDLGEQSMVRCTRSRPFVERRAVLASQSVRLNSDCIAERND